MTNPIGDGGVEVFEVGVEWKHQISVEGSNPLQSKANESSSGEFLEDNTMSREQQVISGNFNENRMAQANHIYDNGKIKVKKAKVSKVKKNARTKLGF